ncbi:MAG: DUF2330 domain-containing protein [Chloroflexales bacterium]|nr:DUF2330 domain-containing protein [Chloroflexales bacterium]
MLRRLLLFATLCLALAPSAALACGMPLNARIPAEQSLIIFGGGRQQIITTMQLDIDRPGAAVVLPVPADPEVDQPGGGDQLFAYLQNATKPLQQVERRIVWRWNDGATSGAAPGGRVSVLGRETLGAYDVARLAADDPQALAQWLGENGYEVPPPAQPVLDAYIADGWRFVAIKLDSAAAESGSLAPLRISFPAQQIVYPMRLAALADRPIDLLLYVLSDHRVQVDNLDTLFAGPLATLAPAPTGDLAALVRGAPYLTKLRNYQLSPQSVQGDFVARNAPSDEPYRETFTVYDDISGYAAFGPAVCLGAAVSVAAIGGALLLRRKFRQVGEQTKAPPPA